MARGHVVTISYDEVLKFTGCSTNSQTTITNWQASLQPVEVCQICADRTADAYVQLPVKRLR